MAEYWNTDPDTVAYEWTMPNYMDRQEWMWLRTRKKPKSKK